MEYLGRSYDQWRTTTEPRRAEGFREPATSWQTRGAPGSSDLVRRHIHGESLRPVWTVPVQLFVYRQLMYLVLFKSLLTAAQGIPAHWVKVQRTGKVRLRYEGASIEGLRCASEGTAP